MAGGLGARRSRRNLAAILWVAASFGALTIGFMHLSDPLAWLVFVNAALWGTTGPYIAFREYRHTVQMQDIRKTYEQKSLERSQHAVAALRARGLTSKD